jgi:serine phosphatase RsbU (regulator of sigma subunit)
MYGQDQLAAMICSHREQSAQEIADAILDDVARFQGVNDRFDDETIVVLKVR